MKIDLLLKPNFTFPDWSNYDVIAMSDEPKSGGHVTMTYQMLASIM